MVRNYHKLSMTTDTAIWRVWAGGPFKLDTSSGAIFKIMNREIFDKLEDICFTSYGSFMSTLQYNQPTPDGNSTIKAFRLKSFSMVESDLIWSDTEGGGGRSVVTHDRMVSLFHYNQYYETFACPRECRFKTFLTRIETQNGQMSNRISVSPNIVFLYYLQPLPLNDTTYSVHLIRSNCLSANDIGSTSGLHAKSEALPTEQYLRR